MNRPVHRETNLQNPNSRTGRWAKITLMALLACCFLFVGCQDTHQGIAKQHLRIMEDMVDILDSVKDKRTATMAAPKLERIAKRMRKLEARAKKLPHPTPEQARDMAKIQMEGMKHMEKIMDFQMRMMKDPEAMAVLTEAFEKIGETNAIRR